ncbi:MAG: right-handed parallel beta-helix repeat-containing protein, partial [Planctomycetota bacterium]|nr:right-handed parallel beta-helix repeat-containing protein [Planctomycetota bacterium]
FESCRFADSKIVDDMVHGVYSEITFLDCRFIRSLSDALDMDISLLTMDGCTFEASGNDSLDLMTTEAVVTNCRFLDSGDKGVSVGERSSLFIVQSELKGCEIGVESKDESVALLVNVDLIENKIGINAYKKNWRYDGGGYATILNTRFSANAVDVAADRHSSLFLDSCVWDAIPSLRDKTEIVLGKDHVRYKADGAIAAPLRPVYVEGWLEQVGLTAPLYGRYVEHTDPKVRGMAR